MPNPSSASSTILNSTPEASSDITPEEQEQVEASLATPLSWAQTYINNPKSHKPFEPNIVQIQALNSFHRYNVIRVHRRCGKTVSLVILALYFLTTMENCEVTYVAPRNNQVQAFWDEMERYIEEHEFIRESVTGGRQKPFSKNFANGSVIKGFTTGAASNNKGDSIRGQGGDVVLLDEVGMMADDDFTALTPIIEGDEYRRFPPIVFAASTPAGAFGQFFEWCMDKTLGWHEIFVPITENPKYSDARRLRIRKQCSLYTWEQEYLCMFKDAGAGVFPVSLVIRAKRGIPSPSLFPMPEYAIGSITQKRYPAIEVAGQPPVRRVWRTMGVDWDKYNADGSGPNIAIVEVDERPAQGNVPGGTGIPEVIYRESIPQGPFVYNETIKRIKELNEMMTPDVIACDAGAGESQIEELKLWGKNHPTTRLDKIVKRVHFGGDVEIADPATGELVKKQFKGFMINVLGKWFEDDMLIYNKDDAVFEKQLKGFKEVSRTMHGVRYSKTNEHIIDAVGLACSAMFMLHKNPFQRRVPMTSYLMPSPEVIAGGSMTKEQRDQFSQKDPVGGALVNTHLDKDFAENTRVKVDETLHLLVDTPGDRSSVGSDNPFARKIGSSLGSRIGSRNVNTPRGRTRF